MVLNKYVGWYFVHLSGLDSKRATIAWREFVTIRDFCKYGYDCQAKRDKSGPHGPGPHPLPTLKQTNKQTICSPFIGENAGLWKNLKSY